MNARADASVVVVPLDAPTRQHVVMTTSQLSSIRLPRTSRPILQLWLQRSRTRRQLRHLDERLLIDIGHSPAERHIECAKWFWQP